MAMSNEPVNEPANEPAPPEGSGGAETLHWLAAARSGEAAAFGKLYERVAPALFTWAELRVRPEQRGQIDPGDVVQEVWLRAWRALDGFDPETTPFRPWIFRIAKNVLLEAFRSLARVSRQGAAAGSSTRLFALENMPDSATAISRRVARDEGLAAFAAQVRELPEEDRKLVVFCGLEALPHKEVAERMELSVEAVTKRWQRLRARLAQHGLPGELLV